jgi:hypothetical protein
MRLPVPQIQIGADRGHHCHYPIGQHTGYRTTVWALYFVIALVAPMIICGVLLARDAHVGYTSEYYARERTRKYLREHSEPRMFRPRAQARFWAAQLPEERRDRLRVTRRPYTPDLYRSRGWPRKFPHYY